MRRGKELRDYRDSLQRKAIEERRNRLKTNAQSKLKTRREKYRKINLDREVRQLGIKSNREFKVDFKPYDEYICSREEPIKVSHVIESLGMGGGQTMMMELILALDKYYKGKVINQVICPRPAAHRYDKNLFESYGITPICVRERHLARSVADHGSHIVVQHRLAVSKCLKSFIPGGVKYILMNHTYHQLVRLRNFVHCDFYVSVCEYLNTHTSWSPHVHAGRIDSILNGVENDYISELPDAELAGDFKTGRCHRMVASKFKIDSLKWMDKVASRQIPGFQHYLIGHNNEAKKICKKSSCCNYMGQILKRYKKMKIIKALDVYFYETQQQEGASIAILESLACGVPVLCKDYGGNPELIRNGVNGFIVKDRDEFLSRMKYLLEGDNLKNLKASTRKDFNERLHARHTACKYMQLFEALL